MKVVRDTVAEGPLYARLLRLRYIHPGALLCFALFEGTTVLAGLLALAELTSWWAVIVLPLTVAGMVKINDVAAGAFAASFTPSLAMAGGSRGGPPERRQLAGNTGARLLPDRTRPLAGIGIGPLADGVRGLLGGRQRPSRRNTAASRLDAAAKPRRHGVTQDVTAALDRTEALRSSPWAAEADPAHRPQDHDVTTALPVAELPMPPAPEPDTARPVGPRQVPVQPASPWAVDDVPTMPLARRGRHAAVTPDDTAATGMTAARYAADGDPSATPRSNSDLAIGGPYGVSRPAGGDLAAGGAYGVGRPAGDDMAAGGAHAFGHPTDEDLATGRVYGMSRPTDDDQTPAVGWLRWPRRDDGEPAGDERLPGHADGSHRLDQPAPQPPAPRSPAAGRAKRASQDEDGTTRYRGGFNQGRFSN